MAGKFMFFAIIVTWAHFLSGTWAGSPPMKCPRNELVVYKVVFETHWDPRDFPKHYPEWRPPAQWSKLIGYSHFEDFTLFRAGETASPTLKEFAENGRSDLLDLHAQGSGGVLDIFHTPPVSSGVGEAQATFFVDGNHSKVSLASKIVPSPDWFVGVDSYELCPGGHWVDSVQIELDPMDAGTDNGLTFTSPNWPTNPQERVHMITVHYPDHPAGSFYYANLDTLPSIATITITKVRQYSKKEKFDAADPAGNDVINDITNLDELTYHPFITKKDEIDEYNKAKISFGEHERLQNQLVYDTTFLKFTPDSVSEGQVLPTTTTPVSSSHSHRGHHHHHSNRTPDIWDLEVTEPGIHTNREVEKKNGVLTQNQKEISVIKKPLQRPKGVPPGDAMALIDDIVRDYQEKRRKLKRRRLERRRLRKKTRKMRPPRDCRVSEWSEWSSCSKTCGIGEQTRSRTIIKHARRGGKPCPKLQETTWCGSARACPRKYFNWSF